MCTVETISLATVFCLIVWKRLINVLNRLLNAAIVESGDLAKRLALRSGVCGNYVSKRLVILICHFECKSKCIGVYVHKKKCPRTVAPLAEERIVASVLPYLC